ncbi:MAG TPA: SpoIIE family protein phosphatase [Kofleriaceae bacterium]|nr:SpoIIE family protein phosphatase [Kofleriaceae bacterium]
MEVNETEAFELDHQADVGAARRRVAVLAAHAGLDNARSNDAALITTELASNIIKHARHGGMLLGCVERGDVRGVSITAWDRGPGMDVDACLRDGMSTAGTAGVGLGAIQRIASAWDAHTRQGVVVSAYVFPRGERGKPSLDIAGVSVPYPGLPRSGDAWASHESGDKVTVIVCDGLGHGAGAVTASRAVIAAFAAHAEEEPKHILQHAHAAARATRGAAATVVRIDRKTRDATVAGVGNVAAWIVGDTARQLVTQHGTLGQVTPALREEHYAFPPNATLVLASDGLKTRIPLDDHRELLARTSLTVAATLWRDYARGRDDATAVVLREVR